MECSCEIVDEEGKLVTGEVAGYCENLIVVLDDEAEACTCVERIDVKGLGEEAEAVARGGLVVAVLLGEYAFDHALELVKRPFLVENEFNGVCKTELVCHIGVAEDCIHHMENVRGDVTGEEVDRVVDDDVLGQCRRPPLVVEVDVRVVDRIEVSEVTFNCAQTCGTGVGCDDVILAVTCDVAVTDVLGKVSLFAVVTVYADPGELLKAKVGDGSNVTLVDRVFNAVDGGLLHLELGHFNVGPIQNGNLVAVVQIFRNRGRLIRDLGLCRRVGAGSIAAGGVTAALIAFTGLVITALLTCRGFITGGRIGTGNTEQKHHGDKCERNESEQFLVHFLRVHLFLAKKNRMNKCFSFLKIFHANNDAD